MNTATILGYLEWILWASSSTVIVYSIVKRVLGHRDAGRWFLAGLTGFLIAGFSEVLLSGLYGDNITLLLAQPYGWVYSAISLGLMMVGGLYVVSGRIEEGSLQVLSGLLIIGLGLTSLYLAGFKTWTPGSILYVHLDLPKQGFYTGEAVYLNITVYPAPVEVEYTVSWGDGVVENYTGGPSIRVEHSYSSSGVYTVTVEASSGNKRGVNSIAVSVSEPPWEPPWPFNVIVKPVADFSSSFWQALTMPFNLQLLTTSPRLEENSEAWSLYEAVLNVSMSGLGLFLAFRLFHAAVAGDARGLVDSVREALVALLLAFTGPYVYNATVDVLNTISAGIIEGVNPTPVVASTLTLIAAGLGLGFFVPLAAHLAALITVIIAVAGALIALRHWLTLTLAASTPLLAVAYLHPGFRGTVKWLLGLWSGILLSGPLTAVFLRVWTSQVGSVGQALTGIFVYAILPNIIGFLGGGMIGGAAWRVSLPLQIVSLKLVGAVDRSREAKRGATSLKI